MKVLLVDDSFVLREAQKRQLLSLGITDILEATDGREAIRTLAQNMPIDLILLDWNMPKVNGFACLKIIRDERQYDSVKIIMCSAESEKDRVIEAVNSGADEYLVKPYSLTRLQEKCEKLSLI